MTKEKLELNMLEAKDVVLKVVHQSEATPIVYKKDPVQLEGTIQAPGNFVAKRKKEHNDLKVHVLYSYAGLFIKLRTEEDADAEQNEAFYGIVGRLIPNPDIAKLKINVSGSRMSTKDLTDLLKFNRFLFRDKDQNARIIENLQKFKLTAQKHIEANDDSRGNVKDLYEIKNESNVDLGFDLMLPVYVGQPAKSFRVDINYTVRERQIDVWLESAELAELLRSEAMRIIDSELKRFPEEYVFIEQ